MPKMIERPLSLEEAVDRGFHAALEGESVIEVAGELAHSIDDRDINEALVIGLAELIHRRLARQRRGQVEHGGVEVAAASAESAGPAVSPPAAKPHAAKALWAWLEANYEAADGTRKALKAFTIDDAVYLRNRSNARADGLIRVRDAMNRAITALRKHRASTIGELPEAARRRVGEGLS